ncbi:hypothetical protein PVAG01_06673 [Phlyctema vagabunda]|uniref:Heterokaryon incompatibility domain-containing protein n=1 Tax=Phlyctema vagabunda TaxID=108571 RepID=A0ABR4PGQ8_9HELO
MGSSKPSKSSGHGNDRKRKSNTHSFEAKRPRLDEGTSHTRKTEETLQILRDSITKIRDKNRRYFHNTYSYIPLKEDYGQEIRVLVIEPGEDDDPIKCRLVPSALPNTRQDSSSKTKSYNYIALSYYWGEGDAIHEITVTSYRTRSKPLQELDSEKFLLEDVISRLRQHQPFSKSGTGTLHVRSNLYAALQNLRDRKKLKTVWIDALCIGQDQHHERSSQVKKMHELYKQAKKVCIWLGDGTSIDAPHPQSCFDFLREILDLKKADERLGELTKSDSIEWRRVMALMHNKWFSRRWVIQELALARTAEVVFGDQTMPWSDFADAIAIFIVYEKARVDQKREAAKTATYMSELLPYDGFTVLGANTLVDFINNVFRRGKDGEIQQRMQSLESLVSNLLAFEAKDPKDIIYAVLSLASDTQGEMMDPRLLPDYKRKSLLDVYVDFIQYCIEKSDSLDILFRYWAVTEKPKHFGADVEKLPSWIPLVSNSAWGSPEQRIQGRHNGDSFVGTSFLQSQACYSASLKLKPSCRFEKVTSGSGEKSNGVLIVQGIRIGKIKKSAPRAAEGMIFIEALKLAGFDHDHWKQYREWSRSESRVPESFWRTLVADRGPNGLNPPSWYPRACLESLNHLGINGDLRPDDVIDLPAAPNIAKKFLERVKGILWQRRFTKVALKTSSKDSRRTTFGLTPTSSEEGDIICVLFGCSVPVVLRKEGDGDAVHFTIIGECYVYGMMNGEAVTGSAFNEERSESFKLR